jgi:hypothetical protein
MPSNRLEIRRYKNIQIGLQQGVVKVKQQGQGHRGISLFIPTTGDHDFSSMSNGNA